MYLLHFGPESRHLRRERVREGKPTNISVVTTDSNEEKKILGDLQPYSHYALAVSVFNYKGEGPQSEPLTFHTPEGGKNKRQKVKIDEARWWFQILSSIFSVPGPPSSLLLESPSETEMILRWTPPIQPNGVLKGYILQYQQSVSTNSLIHSHQY